MIINYYTPGCVSLESIYFTAYKTLPFVDVRRIFSMFLLNSSYYQNKYFSEEQVFMMTETKILKGSLQLVFLIKIMLLIQAAG